MSNKYGNRNIAKMYKEINELRQAIRSEGSVLIQEKWDAVEEHIDYVYRKDMTNASESTS